MCIRDSHFIHILRRNLNIKILMFNNKIYGLTKGQYSPTSELGKVTKSTPMGSLDFPFNPSSLAIGAGATFVGRSLDRETKHLAEMVGLANSHKGASFVDIYQNCNIFNDGAFSELTDKETKSERVLKVEHGEPMIFGKENNKGIHLDGIKPQVVTIGDKHSIDDILVHDETDAFIGDMLSNFTASDTFPEPLGVLYCVERPTYDDLMVEQMKEAEKNTKGPKSVNDLLNAGDTWEVK